MDSDGVDRVVDIANAVCDAAAGIALHLTRAFSSYSPFASYILASLQREPKFIPVVLKLMFTRGTFFKTAVGVYCIFYSWDYSKLREGFSVATLMSLMTLGVIALMIFVIQIAGVHLLRTTQSFCVIIAACLLALVSRL